MNVRLFPSFIAKLQLVLEKIAEDKKSAAHSFRREILHECQNLSDFPYRCRRSIHYNDDNIRDLIFKGYTIIYKIMDDEIKVFALTKYEDYKDELS
ncbi:type II toxin-antitoxin system RelE/ParE family toxin [uncultured Sulfuricurvum sp.]|uniref:type II toxin-antitoxin system RelE/ParE family toxin n=1 Tax=uncultured Sulfuricurvum sp. TaxID=430693 RepID=UPI00261FDB8A|nr:type II toxin-antitoxin system RelE/ParE family toxin [uncultured Sulfuricurvum sp.]